MKANSRVSLTGLLATAVAAPIGGLLHLIGPGVPLYGAFAVFVCGTLLSFSLPHKVDSAKGEARAELSAGEDVEPDRVGRQGREKRPGLRSVGGPVLHALQANASLRALSGFLTLFLAFLLREHPLGGLSGPVSLGLVAVAAGTGNAFGTALGSWLRARGPERIIISALAAALAATCLAAAWYGVLTIAVVAAAAGIAQALGKLSLDALIQRDVPEEVRTSAFARSETALQMAWVIGGAIGIVLPLNGTLGMAVAAFLVALGVAFSVRGLMTGARGRAARPRTV